MVKPIQTQEIVVRWDRTEKATFVGALLVGAVTLAIIGMIVFQLLCHADVWKFNPALFSKLGSVGNFFSNNLGSFIVGAIGGVLITAVLGYFLATFHREKKAFGKLVAEEYQTKKLKSKQFERIWHKKTGFTTVISKVQISKGKGNPKEIKTTFQVFSNYDQTKGVKKDLIAKKYTKITAHSFNTT